MSFNRELLNLYVARYNAGDLDGVIDLYAEDAVQQMPDGCFTGRSAIRDRLAQELNAFSDVNHTVRSFVEQGEAFCESGRSRGPTLERCCCPTDASFQAAASRSRSRGWSTA